MVFRNREDAGRQLAGLLRAYQGRDAVVLGLPRGGVVVAYEIATALHLPLDVLVVRKLGAPRQPELGMGAVAEGGVRYLDHELIFDVGASDAEVEAITARERAEVERRLLRWRGRRAGVPIEGKTAIVVDDGIATGGTARAALRALRMKKPARVVLATGVAPLSALDALALEADEIVCADPVEVLWAIGGWYIDFDQVPDERVTELIERRRSAANAELGKSPDQVTPE